MSGQRVGYQRVSSLEQNPARQLDGIVLDQTFIDRLSGKDVDRPQLGEMLRFVRAGGTRSPCIRSIGWHGISSTSGALSATSLVGGCGWSLSRSS